MDFQSRMPPVSPCWSTFRVGLNITTCLLYTSDAADERSSVDLGGRRIIKKNKELQMCDGPRRDTTKD